MGFGSCGEVQTCNVTPNLTPLLLTLELDPGYVEILNPGGEIESSDKINPDSDILGFFGGVWSLDRTSGLLQANFQGQPTRTYQCARLSTTREF